ncbi:MAG: tyrosine-type recombinase/integrase [Planctomycetota bacterium]
MYRKVPGVRIPPAPVRHRKSTSGLLQHGTTCLGGSKIVRVKVFQPLLEKANLPKIRIHDIRHTYASLLLQAGAPIHYVKEQLGHSTIATTVDLYGHIAPGVNRETLDKLD